MALNQWMYNASMDIDDFESSPSVNDLKDNALKILQQRLELFKSQDPKTGHFDVIFEIDGKILYANKYVMITSSLTLNSWLSDRWRSTDEPVIIESYSFEVFYQFCCFLYSGGCTVTKENVLPLIDAAEFFDIELLKNYCGNVLSKIICDENVFVLDEVAEKYSIPSLKAFIYSRYYSILDSFIKDESKFKKLEKSEVLHFCKIQFKLQIYRELYFLQTLYKWAVHQAQIKKKMTMEKHFDMEEAIKNEFNEFLPFLKVQTMAEKDKQLDIIKFLKSADIHTICARKLFLFTVSEFVEIFQLKNKIQNHDMAGKTIGKIVEITYLLSEYQMKKKFKNSADHIIKNAIRDELAEVLTNLNISEDDINSVLCYYRNKNWESVPYSHFCLS